MAAHSELPAGGIEPPMLNIFISHKTKDEGAAKTLKHLLDSSCRKIDLFLSCDSKSLPRGVPWREAVHEALNKADLLILIYTTPGDNWDWCIYEAGYFAGKSSELPPGPPRGMNKARSLLVLHPPGVQPPPPLAAWQSVPADPDRLMEYFGYIFQMGNPLCHFKGRQSDMENLAHAICDAIAPLREISLRPNKSLTIKVPPSDGPDDLEDLPGKTTVDLDAGTAELLCLQPGYAYPWKRFKSEALKFNFDVEKLIETVSLARTLRAVPAGLRLFRAPHDNCGYRPLVYDVTRKDNGGVEIQLMLAPLPRTVTPEGLNMFERVFALLDPAKKFLREVSETYGPQLPLIDQSSDEKVRRQFLKSILFSIEQIGAEAHNDGTGNPATLPALSDAFDKSNEGEIRDLQYKWKLCRDELKRAIERPKRAARPSDILNPMRAINMAFLRLSLERLQQLASEFQVSELLKIPPPYRDWVPQEFLVAAGKQEEMLKHRDMPVPRKIRTEKPGEPKSVRVKRAARRD
jgi:hypothetical protein